MSADDRQVAGTHYIAEYQHWDYVIDGELDYFAAQVTKYIIRWRKKNGLQDLEKALHFWEKYREEVHNGRVLLPCYRYPTLDRHTAVSRLVAGHSMLSRVERTLLVLLVDIRTADDVDLIFDRLGDFVTAIRKDTMCFSGQ